MNISEIAQLGGTLATVVLFLWYLTSRDKISREAAREGHAAVESLSESIGKMSENTAVQNELLRQNLTPDRRNQ